jgi:hypothetical protein
MTKRTAILKVLDTSSHSGVTFIPDAGGDGDT